MLIRRKQFVFFNCDHAMTIHVRRKSKKIKKRGGHYKEKNDVLVTRCDVNPVSIKWKNLKKKINKHKTPLCWCLHILSFILNPIWSKGPLGYCLTVSKLPNFVLFKNRPIKIVCCNSPCHIQEYPQLGFKENSPNLSVISELSRKFVNLLYLLCNNICT